MYKKLLLYIGIIMLLVIISGCNSTKAKKLESYKKSQTSNQSSQQTKITEKQALEIVKSKLGSLSDKLAFDVKIDSNKDFWRIISYHNYNKEGTGGIQATYYVDINNGKLYEAFINNFDNLIPLDNITFVDESSSEYANSNEYSTKLLMEYLHLEYTEAGYYNRLIKRDNNFYYLMNVLPTNCDLGIWDFYLINKNSNEIFKWDTKNDVLLSVK